MFFRNDFLRSSWSFYAQAPRKWSQKEVKKDTLNQEKPDRATFDFWHPTMILLDFKGPGGVWRDTFSNSFSELFVINASNAFAWDFIDFVRISGPSGDPFGSIFEKSWEFFSRWFFFEF